MMRKIWEGEVPISISQRIRPKENKRKVQSSAGSTTFGEAESRARMRGCKTKSASEGSHQLGVFPPGNVLDDLVQRGAQNPPTARMPAQCLGRSGGGGRGDTSTRHLLDLFREELRSSIVHPSLLSVG
nr:hypothetical protein Itr_chr04CG00010 [Ipomoea trifida]GMC78366.1 hypothetical protein Iba_chr04aCG1090 [Ipomoea batatas]GMC81208.1 hypothetical protein Iba_chr04bCG1830 [Ipomoea batatas]GMC87389.1 hypothetical protein Iba_chr04eCG0020 [Ipomoea batatas]